MGEIDEILYLYVEIDFPQRNGKGVLFNELIAFIFNNFTIYLLRKEQT